MQFKLPKFSRAPKEPDPPGVTVPEWLVRATKFAAWVATFALIYFLWLYTLDIARDRAASMHLTHIGAWVGDWQFWFPHIIGFAVVAFGIPYVAKIAIPTFVSLSWKTDPTAKLWALLIAVAVSLVVISGTFAVQGHTIMERDRDAAVAVESVQQEAAVLASRIADKRAELDDMVTNASIYVRTAASMSPAAYDVFLEQRRDDWQYDRLVSYRATSVDAQRLRDEIATLRDQQERQTAVASVQREVVTERTGWLSATLGWLEGIRAILLSLVMDIVALIMPLIALRLEQARNRQLGMAGGIPQHPGMLEDKRGEEEVIDLSPRDAAKAVFDAGGSHAEAEQAARNAAKTRAVKTELRDADTEETIIDKDGDLAVIVREHTRKKRGKDGKPIKVMLPAEPPQPDEQGVQYDGGGRMGSVADAVTPAESVDATQPESVETSLQHQEIQDQPSELPDLTDDELLEAEQSADEQPIEQEQAEDEQHGEAEAEPETAVIDSHHEPRTEPETDERRLLTVAAE